jgi:hypothetical protein
MGPEKRGESGVEDSVDLEGGDETLGLEENTRLTEAAIKRLPGSNVLAGHEDDLW